jgi:hypothetical protein
LKLLNFIITTLSTDPHSDPLVRGAPDPYQNVTDPKHWIIHYNLAYVLQENHYPGYSKNYRRFSSFTEHRKCPPVHEHRTDSKRVRNFVEMHSPPMRDVGWIEMALQILNNPDKPRAIKLKYDTGMTLQS